MAEKKKLRFPVPENNRRPRRALRVGDAIMHEISLFLLRKVRDPRLTGVNITQVTMTDDLRRARVFFTVFGESSQIEEAIAGFAHAKGFIRGHLGHEIGLRYVPELEFEPDLTVVQRERMDELFKEITAQHDESAEDNH